MAEKKKRRPKFLKNKAGDVFTEGQKVRLDFSAFRTKDPAPPTFAGSLVTETTIEALLPERVALLSVKLGGYWTWDVENLRHSL